jgi:hypothetical protein
MWAQLNRLSGLPPERMKGLLEEFERDQLPAIEQLKGYEGGFVAVDWSAGKAAAVSFWETKEDMEASEKLAGEARQKALDTTQPGEPAREPIVDHYEVVIRR